MMEGIASEAASLAGHLELDNLCWVWDNNHITIEGNTSITFTEDVAARFLAYGWNVLRVGDANDIDRIEHALEVFRQTKGRPTFIVLDSHIGYGSPHKQDTSAAHGEPLGDEEVRLAKRAYGWPEDAKFLVPDGVYQHFAAGIGKRGADARQKWTELFAAYREKYPELAAEIDQMQKRELPAGWDRNLPIFPADPKGIAGREASGKVLNVLAQNIPWLLGGSADLGPSNKTTLTYEGAGNFEAATPGGKNLHFGIREHAMARNRERDVAVEAALVRRNVLHLQRLRAPGHPACGADGVARHLRLHARRDGRRRGWPDPPACRTIGFVARNSRAGDAASRRRERGGRGVSLHPATPPSAGRPGVVAPSPADSGPRASTQPPRESRRAPTCLRTRPAASPRSSSSRREARSVLAVEAHEKLVAEGIRSRVVSMPSWDIFEHQTQEYRDSVLPPGVTARVAVEQASTFGWERYVGLNGASDRHAYLRGVGAAQGTAKEVWLRARTRL